MSSIAVLIGSPRKGGNTEFLARSFIDGAKKNHDIEVITVANIKRVHRLQLLL